MLDPRDAVNRALGVLKGPTHNIGVTGQKTLQAGARSASQVPLQYRSIANSPRSPCQQPRAFEASSSGANLARIGVQMLHQTRVQFQARSQLREIFTLGHTARVDSE